MLRPDLSTPLLTWGEVFVDGDWWAGMEEEASAQQSLQHKTTCLPTLPSCLLPYATPSSSCSLEEKKVVNWGSQMAYDFFFLPLLCPEM